MIVLEKNNDEGKKFLSNLEEDKEISSKEARKHVMYKSTYFVVCVAFEAPVPILVVRPPPPVVSLAVLIAAAAAAASKRR